MNAHRGMGVLVAVVLALGAAGVALAHDPQRPPPPAPRSPPTHPMCEGSPIAPGYGRVIVALIPWGDVWVDSRRQPGTSPVAVDLRAGRHVVEGGQGRKSRRRVINVEAGRCVLIRVDL